MTHLRLICNWSCTYASESQIRNKPSRKYTGRTLGGRDHQNSIYRRPSGPHFLSLHHVLLYFYASNIDHPFTASIIYHLQETIDIVTTTITKEWLHTRVATHHWQQPISQHIAMDNDEDQRMRAWPSQEPRLTR